MGVLSRHLSMGDHGLRYIRTSGFKGIRCTDRVAMELFVLRKYCCVTYAITADSCRT
jgi:hypothetical protein